MADDPKHGISFNRFAALAAGELSLGEWAALSSAWRLKCFEEAAREIHDKGKLIAVLESQNAALREQVDALTEWLARMNLNRKPD